MKDLNKVISNEHDKVNNDEYMKKIDEEGKVGKIIALIGVGLSLTTLLFIVLEITILLSKNIVIYVTAGLFFLSLVVLTIGAILYYKQKNFATYQAIINHKYDGIRKCPKCGKIINPNQEMCNECKEASIDKDAIVICPACGKVNLGGKEYCVDCGKRLR